MRRVLTYDLDDAERAVLVLAQVAAGVEAAGHRARHLATVRAAEMGLPTRLIGLYADYSAAQVSRLSTGKQGAGLNKERDE